VVEGEAEEAEDFLFVVGSGEGVTVGGGAG